jgi:hypothetical protein
MICFDQLEPPPLVAELGFGNYIKQEIQSSQFCTNPFLKARIRSFLFRHTVKIAAVKAMDSPI